MLIDNILSHIKKIRNRHFFYIDVLFVLISPFLALLIRLDESANYNPYISAVFFYALYFSILKLMILYSFRIYSLMWNKAGVDEIQKLGAALFLIMVVQVFLFNFFDNILLYPFSALPSSIPYLDGILFMILCFSSRMSLRLIEHFYELNTIEANKTNNVLILGAGYAGVNIVQSMQYNRYAGYKPVAFLDDAPEKQKLILRGVPILGKISDLPTVLESKSFDYVVIAMPRVSGAKIRDIAESCKNSGVKLLTVPSISEILDGKVNITRMREVQIEDLLRREQVNTNSLSVQKLIKGRRILVTGGGGSIGSELCRQLIKFKPAELIVLGHGENSIFEIEQELRSIFELPENSDIKLSTFIADLRMKERLRTVFTKFKPHIVFHAAAHKHVPLMEDNPQEAISNNIIGTKNLVDLAIDNNVISFVGISTDKAVNPTNIMGATKRTSEMIILDAAKKTGRYFSVVRFGNVLGSRGSVVKTFENQIKKGGPITLTHPSITRYFMTIPEAVQLVLQASILGFGGDIFVLDMGRPVKILDLARDMIRLSGLNEGTDIKIKVTGLRPGEKLFEELYLKNEIYEKTENEKIFIAQNASQYICANLNDILTQLIALDGELSKLEIFQMLTKLVPEFKHKDFRNIKTETLQKKLA